MDTVTREVEDLGAEVLAVHTDVTDENAVCALFDTVYRRWGRIDVLVNDAGIAPHFAVGAPRWPRVRDLSREFFENVIDTNLVGTFLCTKHALPYMESIYWGHIINFGQGGFAIPQQPQRPSIGSCVYNVSKIAIRAFTRNVAEEEREFNICIVSMGPGGPMTSEPVRPRQPEPGGVWGGIVTEDSPEWARASGAAVHVDIIGNRYVLAAEAPMEMSGHQLVVRDGKLEIARD
jgi:NAD(P)-dependent dehydrogenase (short-subunit alcohol dehydrogenase family)